MPATEATWRDQKLLHRIFAVTCLFMLGGTLWMFAADHSREWKPYSRQADRIEIRMSDWREHQFQTEESLLEHDRLERDLSIARSQPLPEEGLTKFKQLAGENDLSGIDNLVAELQQRAGTATEKRRAADAAETAAREAEKRADEGVAALEAAKQALGTAPADQRQSAENKYYSQKSQIEDHRVQARTLRTAVISADHEAEAAEEAAHEIREKIFAQLDAIVRKVRFREDNLLRDRKFAGADRDAALAKQGLLLRDGRPAAEQEAIQQKVNQLDAQIKQYTLEYQTASRQRRDLQSLIAQMRNDEDLAHKAVAKSREELKNLQSATASKASNYINYWNGIPVPGKKWLELPILDAFNSPRKIDNLWSDGLTIDYNFRKVRRFDRCTTCHKSIEKSLPGNPNEPGYAHAEIVDFLLVPPTPEEVGASASRVATDEAESNNERLERIIGVRLAGEGLVTREEVAVSFVRPQSAGARATFVTNAVAQQARPAEELRDALLQPVSAELFSRPHQQPGLMVGDVIARINGDQVYDANKAAFRLLEAVRLGEIIKISVRRGLPGPYTSHPRLDLFVGSMSPHKLQVFACTSCHDGQGSATSFNWSSHTPNNARQRADWTRDHGWFDNEHWIFPMYAKRFAESTCLKCHHDVVELLPSERFPEPPAPKVTHGYDLVRKYGCYGCHEINGFDGPRRLGPDMRLEPNYFAAAQAIKADPSFDQLDQDSKDWVEELMFHPDRDGVRRSLLSRLSEQGKAESPLLAPTIYSVIVPLLRDAESAGTFRRPGPSLRFARQKLDTTFLYDWIREPKNFRPTTRMPQFFELWNHLDSAGKHVAQTLEPVEIFGIVSYLQDRSQKFDFLEPPAGITESTPEEKVGRGKTLFQTRGCLACHPHKDFPDAEKYRDPNEIIQGPDLSGVGVKFSPERNPVGRKWLYSWIKEPTRYHVRTVMPNLYLEPIESDDGKVSDPVDDIVEYLLSNSKNDWQPAEGAITDVQGVNGEALHSLMLEHLKDAFFETAALQYADRGIPESMRKELKGAETELVVTDDLAADESYRLPDRQKLAYIGRKTIAKYGCYGCHDIPGFEDAKPIGTGLADWGRKDASRLAFEHIAQYLEHGHGVHTADRASEDSHTAHDSPAPAAMPEEFYMEQLEHGNRIGFIHQKLLEPRSYDYHRTGNKKYNERLRMPLFPLTQEQREAVITFVLGLVADPPEAKYIYRPSARQVALSEGRKVLETFNCGGCHVLEAEKWSVTYREGAFGPPAEVKIYPFLRTPVTSDALLSSQRQDRRGEMHATLSGMPTLADDGRPLAYDSEGDPIEPGTAYPPASLTYPLDLWRPAIVDGAVHEVGLLPLNLTANQVDQKQPSNGGFLAKYLLPHVVALEKQVNPAAKGTEAWGWLPPPLLREGEKVQPEWLHSFLLDPYPIRPATFLRMPKFNLSAADATALVSYFAAKDNADYPYEFAGRQRNGHLQREEAAYEEELKSAGKESGPTSRFDDAMKIVVDNNYCIKCHLVGDFMPKGSNRAKAPNLADVHRRLRPEYVRHWIANPKTILPYTSMPVNIPYDPDLPMQGGVSQELYHGTSVQQVDGLVDLLMNFDEYSKARNSVAPLVKEAPPAESPAAEAATSGGE